MSALGLGGFHLAGHGADETEAIRLVRRAIEEGITFLDNCWDYNDGESERRMGKALCDGYRKHAFVMTKIDGRTKAAAMTQIDESLQRLQTDVIDLLQFHEIIRLQDANRIFALGGAMSRNGEAGALRPACEAWFWGRWGAPGRPPPSLPPRSAPRASRDQT